MKSHNTKHRNNKPFQCQLCHKCFTEKGHLKCHYREVHFKLKNFECSFCGKKFGRKSSLTSHNRRIHIYSPYDSSPSTNGETNNNEQISTKKDFKNDNIYHYLGEDNETISDSSIFITVIDFNCLL